MILYASLASYLWFQTEFFTWMCGLGCISIAIQSKAPFMQNSLWIRKREGFANEETVFFGAWVGLDDEWRRIGRRRNGTKILWQTREPVFSVLNQDLLIYRKRRNMRRAFVISLAICLIASSLDGRFVYSPWPGNLWEESQLMFPNSGL